MTIRNATSSGRSAETERSVDDQILDAARACVEEFGVKRTTLTEVARRASVSRPTVYRRWPDSNALVGDMLTREVRSTLAGSDLIGCDSRAKLVQTIVDGIALLRDHPLFAKIFRTDSDLLLTYIVDRLGRSQIELLTFFTSAIEAGQRGGSIRTGDPNRMATMLLLISQSAAQSGRIVESRLGVDDLATELAHAIDSYLRPVGDSL
ncbi:TetR/AcrR family transcriptional regulator [Antrihabitans cavernicola]|uniref:TetR/AcrR family transcriptional regulator n=1 Tax=Antrihabitans cavernicola TaxID=2495913 RepID=A0A5A7S9V2_9NOCA|nr:TetR/AcrR family transcriptional regulator [Spelaeibacter cavernicola]KAA0022930.1 TetR/AcrR family transcriptional regulator [Spelaeibacter cavernicola]